MQKKRGYNGKRGNARVSRFSKRVATECNF